MRHLDFLETLKSAPDPTQAQVAFEKRARIEDLVAHTIAVILTLGFFILALAALLGFVDVEKPIIAGLIGTVLGYAVGKMQSVMTRYFEPRFDPRPPPTQEKSP